jgi:hypothetical protein
MVMYQLRVNKWNIEEMNGYRPMTTFWEDFEIAEKYGYKAVQDTYKRAFINWRTDYKYLTELVLVLNHKAWQHQDSNQLLSDLYVTLYEVADNFAIDNLQGHHLKYFFEVTD